MRKPARWFRTPLATLIAVLLLLGATVPAEASYSVAAPGSGNCQLRATHVWFSQTSISWSGGTYCNAILPSQWVNNELRRQTGYWFWEWSTFDSCSSGWVYNDFSAACGDVSTTVQEYTGDHEIVVNYYMTAPSGTTWNETGGPIASGTYKTDHFKYPN